MVLTLAALFSRVAALNFILRQRVRAYTTVKLVEMRVSTYKRRRGGRGGELKGQLTEQDQAGFMKLTYFETEGSSAITQCQSTNGTMGTSQTLQLTVVNSEVEKQRYRTRVASSCFLGWYQ